MLAPYLPNTTLTSYQVIYAEGVEAGDVIYPKFTRGRHRGRHRQADLGGFTLVDARTYFEATTWQECAGEVYGDTYDTPE